MAWTHGLGSILMLVYVCTASVNIGSLTLTGVPFHDAYRYRDGSFTVPMLLIEIFLVRLVLDHLPYLSN